MIKRLLFFTFVLLSLNIFSVNIYVDKSAAPGGDGTSWATAFNDIQRAVDAASANDVIFIAEGIYKPQAEIDITIPLSIRGGYPQGGGVQNIPAHVAQIQADFNPSNLLSRIFDIAANSDTSMEGLRFFNTRIAVNTRSNLAVDKIQFNGGTNIDIYTNGSFDTLTVSNCLFSNSSANSIYLLSTVINNINIENCIFQNGTGTVVSAYDNSTNFSMTDCIIRNYVSLGTLLRINSINTILSNLTVTNNNADIFSFDDNLVTINNMVATNNIDSRILFHRDGTLNIYNSIFTENNGNRANCIQSSNATLLNVENCVFNNNSSTNGGVTVLNSNLTNTNLINSKFNNNSSVGTFNNSVMDVTGGNQTVDILFTIDGCEFKNNDSNGYSAVEIEYYLDLVLTNSLFDNNGGSNNNSEDLDLWYLDSALITNNTFLNNASNEEVIAIGVMNVNPAIISNNVFLNNNATEISVDRVDDYTASHNKFYGDNIRVDIDRSPLAQLTNEYFEGNITDVEFLKIEVTDITISNSTFISTKPNGDHTVIESRGDVSLKILNSTLSAANYADTHVIIDFDDDLPSWIRNSVVWSGSDLTESALDGNTSNLTITHSLIKGENPAGAGNLNGNQNANRPRFSDPSDFDFRMRRCSPTVNAGNNPYNSETNDLLNNARIFETTIDMGAYELQELASTSCEALDRPLCTALTVPSDGDTNVIVNTDLSWTADSNATGYILRVGTALGTFDLVNETLGNVTNYNLQDDLPTNTEIFVRIIPFNGAGNALSCVSESFTTEIETILSPTTCTSLATPANGETGVDVDTDITWNADVNADGYRITIGTTSGSNDILDSFDVGNNNAYDFPLDLPESTQIFVTINPYNSLGASTGCGEESFTTGLAPTVPECTAIDNPDDGDINVPVTTDIFWDDIASADGYRLTVGTTSGGNDIVDNEDVGNVFTYDFLTDLPGDTEVFINITPYNAVGDAVGCAEESFTTETIITGNPFITTWETATANETITIPTRAATYTYDYTIDWGDGTIDTNVTGNITHSYATAGIQTISILGVFPQIHFNGNAADRDKILTIEQWGDVEWLALTQAFKGCSNLTIINPSIDVPNLSSVTNMSEAFRDATSFNGDITAWDVSTVTNMLRLFNGAESFNQDIGNWNISNVVNMTRLFERARVFNQDIGNWNTSNVTTMAVMFAITDDFNQDIGNWDTSNVTSMNTMFGSTASFNQDIGGWDVGNVTNFTQMFISAEAFNQDIGDWDVSQATQTLYMFQGADNFDQNLGNWNVSNITGANGMFNGITLSVANYEALLIGWSSQNLQPNVPFSGGFSTYCSQQAQDARANMIASDGWTITDGGLSASPTFDAIANLTVADTYTLPAITGTNLTGNELYYTGSNGTGTAYMAGAIIAYADFPSYPITLYVYDSTSCNNAETSFELTITESTVPNCTTISMPVDGAIDVPITSDLSWNAVPGADGYIVTIGTSSGGTDIFDNINIGINTTVSLPDFPENTEIFITIIPYNSVGNATGCIEESFTTETLLTIPECTTIDNPDDGDNNVPVTTDIFWDDIATATGYRLTVGTTSGGNDIVDNENVGNVFTYDFLTDLPENTEIFVNIIPYNAVGNAIGCDEESFTTETLITATTFITTWKTDNTGVSNDNQITIPTFGGGYNYNVNWGDGNTTIGETGNATHTYATVGTYTVSISGDFPRIHFDNGFDKEKILTIEQWGDNLWTTMESAFYGCTNLNITNPSIDEPDLSNVTDLDLMFQGCSSFNGDITNWDVSTIETMRSLFLEATVFNQNIGGWDVSNVQTLDRTFSSAIAFNQDISSWNVGNVTDMLFTFYNAESFNQPIQSWNVSNVTRFARTFEETEVFNQPIGVWDTSSAVNISGAFSDAVAFNQDLSGWDVSNVTLFRNVFDGAILFNQDIGNWDTSSATDMLFMFRNASAFNQDIGNWNVSQVFRTFAMFENATAFNQDLSNWNVESITTAERMFDGITLSTDNYDALLIGWNAQNLQPNVIFSGGNSQYCLAEADRTNMIDTDLWVITDGGSASNSNASLDAVADVTSADAYTLPAISGTNLTGNERYYTETNGNVTEYDVGDVFLFADFPSYPITLYIFDTSVCNSSEIQFQLTITESIIPNCTSLVTPLNGATDVSISTDLTWTAIANADGYFLSVGTASGGTDILDNEDVTNTTFDLPADLPENTEIFVTIIPYNSVGNATGCAEESFTTETLATIPNCTSLVTPLNGATNVSIATDLTWTAIANADGYFVTIGTTSGGTDILDNEDVTNTTFNLPANLSENTEIFVTIIPYNGVGNATGCTEESFTTETVNTSLAFITTWKTDNPGVSGPNQITIPTFTGETYNYDVDWGDGTNTSGETGNATHTYTTPGNYTVSITGLFPRLFFDNNGDREKLLTINQWGDNPWTSMESAFEGCTNVTGNFTDSPDLSNVTSLANMLDKCRNYNSDMDDWDVSTITIMSNMFIGAYDFNGNIETWDTSNVTSMERMFANTLVFNRNIGNWNTSSLINMSQMFFGAQAFNQNINLKLGMGIPFGDAWDTSNVTDMEGVFWNASVFNSPIGDWNTSNVEDMSNMFFGASVFNQNIGNWDVTSVQFMYRMFILAPVFNQDIGAWTVDNVETFYEMFSGASAFNQDIGNWNIDNATDLNQMFANAISFNQDISGWNTSSVTNMAAMFSNAGAFDQNLGAWNVEAVTNAAVMFNFVTLSTANYDALLIGWNAQNLQPNVIFSGGNSQYCEGASARANMISGAADNWTITDGGLATGPTVDDLADQTHVDSYTLPVITGTLLTGNEAYFTEPNGGGTQYNIGDIINFGDFPSYPITLYIYDGSGACADEESFELILTSSGGTIPNCTSLATPLNGATNVSIATDLTWTAIANADGYFLSIGTTSGGIDILDSFDVGNFTTYDLALNLPETTEIFVTIIPYNGVGDAIGCTEESFTTETLQTLPGCTALTTPLNGATNVPVDTNLSWDAAPDATGYIIAIGTSSQGSEILFNLNVGNTLTYNPPLNLPANTEIFVRILPSNSFGNNPTGCVEESFVTGPAIETPNCTNLVMPLSSATDVSIITDLSWNAVTDTTGYLVTIGTTSGGNDILDNFDVGNFTTYDLPTDLPENTEIFVTIIPYNGVGNATGCAEESFTTETNATIPNCTALTLPLNGATDVSISTDLTWSAITNADGYLLTVGTTSGGNDILDNFDVDNFTTYDLPTDLPENTEIFVTIIPYNGIGNASGCAEESFTTETIATIPNCTTLTSPLNGATDVSISADLTWSAITNADGYLITIGTTSGGNDILDNFDVDNFSTYDLPTDLPENTEIFVTIIPYNGVGNAADCTEESFTTEETTIVLDCTTLIMPLAGATDVSVSTDFSWNAVPNANGYLISIGTATVLLDAADVGNALNYDMPFDLPENTEIIVQITPYINLNETVSCPSEWFTTGAVPTIPECTSLAFPLDGATSVLSSVDVSWNAVTDADGYRLIIGTTSGGNDILDNFDVGNNTTYDLPTNLPDNTTIYVSIIPYNDTGEATGCTEESFTTLNTNVIPICTRLISPLDLAIDVAVNTDLTWVSEPNATGYRLSVGTTTNGVDILDDADVGNVTTYNLPSDLPENTEIFVNIVPYNSNGEPSGCFEESFTTEIIPVLPECINLLSPLNTSINIAVTTDLTWEASTEATGYILNVSSVSGGTDIVDNLDVGNTTTYDLPFDLPENTEIFVSVFPYNDFGIVTDCTEEQFTTGINSEFPEADDTKYGFSPDGDGINEFWHIKGIENFPNNEVRIYNRWGDLVFLIKGYDNNTKVFRGEANRKTELGAGKLPSGTYFFDIQISGNHNLKKTRGYVIIKR